MQSPVIAGSYSRTHQELEMKRIYIGNLSRETTEQELEAAFGAYGEVLDVAVIRDRESGTSRGFGFIEMENEQEATAAITALDQSEISGRTVTVNEARPRTGGGGGGRRDRGGGGRRGDR